MKPLLPYRSIDEVHELLFPPEPVRNLSLRPKKKTEYRHVRDARGMVGLRNAAIQERRALIRRAFDVVRYDPSRQEAKTALLSALAGNYTEEIDALARSILAIARS